MKRITALLVGIAICLCGCGDRPELTAQMLVRSQAASVVLAYPAAEAGGLGESAARMMGEQVSMNTGNTLLLECQPQEKPLDALRQGNAQLALVTSQELAQENHGLSVLTGPFLWKDYLNFAASANSEEGREMMETLLSPSVQVKVLGAFYGGGKNLLFRAEFLPDSDPEKFAVGVPPTSAIGAILYSAGFSITALDDQQLAEQFQEGKLDGIEGSWAVAARLAEEQAPLFVLPTHHQVDCLWLVADSALWQSLSPAAQVQVADSVAAVLQISDEMVLRRLEKEQNQAEEAGAVELIDRYRDLEGAAEAYLEENYGTEENSRLLELCLEMRN